MTEKKVLFILTSHDQLGDTGRKTGWYAEEAAEPATILYAAGYDIVYASPKGGVAPLDPSSVEAAKGKQAVQDFLNNAEIMNKIQNTHKLEDVAGRWSEFDAIVYPGGHGPMYDLLDNKVAQQITAQAYEAGKVVAAVCHGPIALTGVVLSDGSHLVKGKQVTGFSNVEEELIQLTKAVPVLLETRFNEVGANYVVADQPWGEKVVTDSRVVTGQNPASAEKFGHAILAAIQETQRK